MSVQPEVSRNGMEHLAEDDCWKRLAGAPVCRLAFALDGRTEIIPVNHVVLQHRLLFRTVPDTGIDRAVGESVALEVDGWTDREAWSVVVRGQVERVADADGIRRAEEVGLEPWPSRDQPPTVLVEVVAMELRGRRFPRRPQPGTLWYW
ncbi:MAG: pyridoxamine 5-phosphate oxidase-related FMN-bin ding protein [Amnibacterium sp.]|nr:pyridoxamine 5-phosphate oxidase-related FMN-bin ding protein [Amnibacterium sp.]